MEGSPATRMDLRFKEDWKIYLIFSWSEQCLSFHLPSLCLQRISFVFSTDLRSEIRLCNVGAADFMLNISNKMMVIYGLAQFGYYFFHSLPCQVLSLDEAKSVAQFVIVEFQSQDVHLQLLYKFNTSETSRQHFFELQIFSP